MTLIEKMQAFKSETGVQIKFEIKSTCGTQIDIISNGPIVASKVADFFKGARTGNRVRITWNSFIV